jgi:tetratricopeptide (TPR) repeat protein
VAELWLAKGKLHVKASERNAALEAFDRALEAVPGHNEAQLRRGVLRLEAGQEAEGRADLVELYERTGGYPGLAAPLGRLYVRDGDFEALERLVDDRLSGDATPDELLTVGARLRLHQGRTAHARELLELAIARHPADWEPHMLLAQVLILEGKAAEALAEIERARPPGPEPEQMLQRGKILEFNGRHDDAIPEYQRALGIDPELHEARFLYGRMLHYKGGHAKAISELRKVLDEPRAKAAAWYPEVWLNIGVAQQAQGKHADAIASLEKATALDPKLGEAWAKMGRFHGDRNEHAKAIAALEKAIAVGPEDAYWYPDALMDLGRAQSKSGKQADAKTSLEQFLELAPPDHTSRAEADRLLGEL